MTLSRTAWFSVDFIFLLRNNAHSIELGTSPSNIPQIARQSRNRIITQTSFVLPVRPGLTFIRRIVQNALDNTRVITRFLMERGNPRGMKLNSRGLLAGQTFLPGECCVLAESVQKWHLPTQNTCSQQVMHLSVSKSTASFRGYDII